MEKRETIFPPSVQTDETSMRKVACNSYFARFETTALNIATSIAFKVVLDDSWRSPRKISRIFSPSYLILFFDGFFVRERTSGTFLSRLAPERFPRKIFSKEASG